MKKIIALFLAALMMVGMTACGNENTNNEETGNKDTEINEETNNKDAEANKETEQTPESIQFTISYPDNMTAQGYEPLVLEKTPARIVCTATSPVPTLYAMGASLVAIPTSSATAHLFTENPELVALKSLMSDEFNIEDVVALNPDLVILATSYKDSYGTTLEGLGINVYYQAAGHGVSYETVKEESMCLIDAFAVDAESKEKAEQLKNSFTEIEAACAELSSVNSGKKIMVLQAGGVNYVYGQTSGGTLGSMMKMLGFENVADATAAASMFAIDYETALVDQPDLLVVVGSGSASDTETMMAEIIASNPQYWNTMTAISEGQVLYLGIDYIAVYGIGYVSALESLAEDISAFYAE